MLTRVDQMHRMCRLYRARLFTQFLLGTAARHTTVLSGIFFDPAPVPVLCLAKQPIIALSAGVEEEQF